jgi:hypothetical protein
VQAREPWAGGGCIGSIETWLWYTLIKVEKTNNDNELFVDVAVVGDAAPAEWMLVVGWGWLSYLEYVCSKIVRSFELQCDS